MQQNIYLKILPQVDSILASFQAEIHKADAHLLTMNFELLSVQLKIKAVFSAVLFPFDSMRMKRQTFCMTCY